MKAIYVLLSLSLLILSLGLKAEENVSSAESTLTTPAEESITESSDVDAEAFARAQKISISFGAGLQRINLDFGISDSDESGLATSFKANLGISDFFTIGILRNVSWFEPSFSDELYAVGFSGFGANYYFKPTLPAAYGLAAFGITEIDSITDDSIKEEKGRGILIGGGIQVSKNLQFELTHFTSDFDDVNLETGSTQITLNYVVWFDLK